MFSECCGIYFDIESNGEEGKIYSELVFTDVYFLCQIKKIECFFVVCLFFCTFVA